MVPRLVAHPEKMHVSDSVQNMFIAESASILRYLGKFIHVHRTVL